MDGRTAVENILAQSGVMGMKWGVRKDRGAIRRGATKANVALGAGSKAITEGEKKLIFLPDKHRMQAAAATQSRVLGEAASLNSDARFKGKDLKTDPKLRSVYHKEMEKRAIKIYAEELNLARARAWIDAMEAVTSPSHDSMTIKAPSKKIKHADEMETLLTLNFKLDGLAHIVGVSVADDELVQGAEFFEDFFEHFGVKGMHWGVRKRDTSPTPVTVAQKPGKRVQTSGGKNLPAHEDAKVAASARQKAKASSTDSLSNKELQALVTRMNLEQQFQRLDAQPKSAGRKFVETMFRDKKKRDQTIATINAANKYPSAASSLAKDLREVKLD